jgi:hypothetical protein
MVETFCIRTMVSLIPENSKTRLRIIGIIGERRGAGEPDNY